MQIPTTFHGPAESEQPQTQPSSYADLPWWQVFQDPQLQELVRTALKQNYDLQLAAERINAARAQLGITRSNQFPQVQGDANATGGKEYTFQSKSNFLCSLRTLPSSWISSAACGGLLKRPALSFWPPRMLSRRWC